MQTGVDDKRLFSPSAKSNSLRMLEHTRKFRPSNKCDLAPQKQSCLRRWSPDDTRTMMGTRSENAAPNSRFCTQEE